MGEKQLPPLSIRPVWLTLSVMVFSHILSVSHSPFPYILLHQTHFISLSVSLRESKSMHSAFLLHNLHIGLVFQSQVTSQMELSPKPLRATVWWSAEALRLIQSAVGGITLLSTLVLFYPWFRWDEEEQDDMTLLQTLTCFNISGLKSRGEKQGARWGKVEHHPPIGLV